VCHLLAIEEVMNTTLLSCLLSRVTLDEVWFSYKAWGPSLKVRDSGDKITDFNEGKEEEEEDPNSKDEAFLLIKLLKLN
jgi:hypothetical protein